MNRTLIVTVFAASVVILAGCDSQPSRDEVATHFKTELTAKTGLEKPEELANRMAEDALSGECSSKAYRSQLQPDLAYVWDVSCLMYFEDQMTHEQIDRAKAEILNDILKDSRGTTQSTKNNE